MYIIDTADKQRKNSACLDMFCFTPCALPVTVDYVTSKITALFFGTSFAQSVAMFVVFW